jgi:hypothetical protein
LALGFAFAFDLALDFVVFGRTNSYASITHATPVWPFFGASARITRAKHRIFTSFFAPMLLPGTVISHSMIDPTATGESNQKYAPEELMFAVVPTCSADTGESPTRTGSFTGNRRPVLASVTVRLLLGPDPSWQPFLGEKTMPRPGLYHESC